MSFFLNCIDTKILKYKLQYSYKIFVKTLVPISNEKYWNYKRIVPKCVFGKKRKPKQNVEISHTSTIQNIVTLVSSWARRYGGKFR